jgi:predicted acyltransferase
MNERARLASVDALRGLTVAAMLLVNDPGDWGHVYAPLEHAAWHGCTPTDLIFPLFLFIVGVSITLAGPAPPRAVVWRALRIVALGLVLHAVAHWAIGTREFRPMGVLQRIGICYGVAGLLALQTRARAQWLVFWALLAGYAALLAWGGPLTKAGNLASRIDTALLGRFAYEFDAATGLGHDPEGLLATLPAIATTLLGVRAGAWLRSGSVRTLWAAAAIALLLGAAWSPWQPLNKQLWTPSFVLWTGGWALAVLGLAHALIDRWQAPPLGRAFGVNAIAAYAGAWLMTCALEGLHWGAPLYRHGFAWLTPWFGPEGASLAYAVAFTAFWWVLMRILAQRGVRIRI